MNNLITLKIQGRYKSAMYCTNDLELALMSEIMCKFGDNAYFIEDESARSDAVITGKVGHMNKKGKRTLSQKTTFIDFKIS